MAITSLHGTFTYFLPMKTGELSYIWMLKKHVGISLPEGVATLLAARYLDLALAALFLPAVIIPFKENLPPWIFDAAIVYFLGVCIATFFVIYHLSQSTTSNYYVETGNHRGWIHPLRRAWNSFSSSLRMVHAKDRQLSLLLTTVAIWLCIYTSFYCTVQSIGFSVSYVQMVAVSIIMVPITLLPLQGFANIGTHEVAFIVGFRLFGYTQEEALLIAVSSHVIVVIFVLILGLFGCMLLRAALKN